MNIPGNLIFTFRGLWDSKNAIFNGWQISSTNMVQAALPPEPHLHLRFLLPPIPS
jgi:hypothetical protein